MIWEGLTTWDKRECKYMPRGQKGADKDKIINSEDETIFDGCSVERGHQACLLGQSQSFFLEKSWSRKDPTPTQTMDFFTTLPLFSFILTVWPDTVLVAKFISWSLIARSPSSKRELGRIWQNFAFTTVSWNGYQGGVWRLIASSFWDGCSSSSNCVATNQTDSTCLSDHFVHINSYRFHLVVRQLC